MCLTPSLIWVQRGPKFDQQEVACRVCWQCKAARVNDFVGRSLAEASTSVRTCTLSLTYAPRDDLADKVIQPRHFQLFIKLLRRAGHKVRYLVAGEYGELFGRTHFHAILFFSEFAEGGTEAVYNPHHVEDPSSSARFSVHVPHNKNVHIFEWPHGHVFCDWSSSEASIRYVCKYLLADFKNNSWFSLSKKPPLGSVFFAKKALEAKTLGALPSAFVYSPPGGTPGRSYPITGASRRDYLNAITVDPVDRERMSEFTRKSFDKLHLARAVAALEALPAAVTAAAYDDLYEMRSGHFKARHNRAALELVRRLDDAISHGTGELLRFDGVRWVPSFV